MVTIFFAYFPPPHFFAVDYKAHKALCLMPTSPSFHIDLNSGIAY
jgi:hypothetical protein